MIALFGIGGIHRFYLADVGLGIAHLLTVGFCWVGTIVDIIAIDHRVNLANVKIAMEIVETLRASRRVPR